jgi:hypothetical protein
MNSKKILEWNPLGLKAKVPSPKQKYNSASIYPQVLRPGIFAEGIKIEEVVQIGRRGDLKREKI